MVGDYEETKNGAGTGADRWGFGIMAAEAAGEEVRAMAAAIGGDGIHP